MGDRVLVPVEWDDAMLRAFYEKRCPPDDTPAGGLTRWASWDDIKDSEGPRIAACWKAALSAAPSSGGGETVELKPSCWPNVWPEEGPEIVENNTGWHYGINMGTRMPCETHPGKALSVEEVARIIREGLSGPTFTDEEMREAHQEDIRNVAQAILAAMGRTSDAL